MFSISCFLYMVNFKFEMFVESEFSLDLEGEIETYIFCINL